MTNLRELFFDNPELWRNLRIELSPKRATTAGIITALFALVVLPSLMPIGSPATNAAGSNSYLTLVLWIQRITLTVGGSISCWRAVRHEREMNTYDFQRITRLSPLEMTVGKLFGSPALAYFVTLCFIPPAVLSAATAGPSALVALLRNYFLLFTASLVLHSFALMISTVSDKGGAVSSVSLLLLLQVFPVVGWIIIGAATASNANAVGMPALQFYGISFPPTILWAALELGFTAWILLAVVRNIKIDLEATQLFTVRQGLGFAAYCNFVWIGFYPWKAAWGSASAGSMLLLSVAFFYAVGIGVLQSRELVRRELRETPAGRSESGKLLGPIALFALGAILVELVVVLLAEHHRTGELVTTFVHDLYLALYFATWMARDLFYLQWMKARPVRSPLRKAFLYLGVFYLSVSIVFRSVMTSAVPGSGAFAAWMAPFPLLRNWTEAERNDTSGWWLLALSAQVVAAAAFAYLYQQEVAGLSRPPKTVSPATPPRPSATAA